VDDALSEFIGDFIVGNVLMTMNSPEYLQTSEKEAWALVTKLAKEWGKSYAITPRFAPTTGPALMAKGAKLMREKRLFAQSHLSETRDEIDYVLSLFKKIKGFEKVKTYTEIYQKVGLLGPRVIMAHGIHLSAPELKLLAKTKTVIAHCPTSNAPVNERGLGSGLFDFAKTEKAGVRWALGSDIGAGPYLSMFDVMKSFVDQNKRAGVKGATYSKALFRATLAGAEALGQQKYSGNLEVGKWANFLLVKNPKNAQKTNAEEFLSLLHAPLKKDRQKSETLVAATFYRGEKIYQRESSKTTGQ
jgi:guanine deaminase